MLITATPGWLKEMERVAMSKSVNREKRLTFNRFRISLAALYATPSGSRVALAELCDVSATTLSNCSSTFHGVITPDMALKLEAATFRKEFDTKPALHRSFFRPDMFESV